MLPKKIKNAKMTAKFAKPSKPSKHASKVLAVSEEVPVTFPMRINKYLALKKYSTRRGADEIIAKGQVLINGKVAVLGSKVQKEDKVEVRFRDGKPAPLIYIAYSKPRGVATHDGQDPTKGGGFPKGVFPVTGLDKESHGLVILTNDGRITERLLSPAYEHEKEYIVVTKNNLRSSFKEKAEAGMKIDDEETSQCKIKVLNPNTFRIILHDEKKHQVRRMCAAVFQEVSDIQCMRIMNVTLGKLKEGGQRKIDGGELQTFLRNLGLA
jgi:23S rRNA pseudouridine2604 synthase